MHLPLHFPDMKFSWKHFWKRSLANVTLVHTEKYYSVVPQDFSFKNAPS